MYDTGHMNKSTSYHPAAKFFHWTMVALIAVQYLSGWLMPFLRHSTSPNYFKFAHLSLGFLVVLFAAALLFMRFYRPVARPETDNAASLIRWATTGTHYLLYILLVVVSFSGLASASVRSMKIDFIGLFNVPLLQIGDPSFLHSLAGMHGALTDVLGVVAIAHIGAALYHHFVLRDSVLNRMRPQHPA